MLELLPSAPVLHIGIFREKTTFQPVEYYSKLPSNRTFDVCYILDPSVATGGTISAAVDMLKEAGVKKIVVITICASKVGVKFVAEKHPDVHFFGAALDESLSPHGFIVPGFGDAGDRLFNSNI